MAAERKFFVEFNTHNGKTDAWNFKQTKKFDTYDTARKEFHNILSTYIEYGDLDHVGVILFDSFANTMDHEYWDKPEEPGPEPEPNAES